MASLAACKPIEAIQRALLIASNAAKRDQTRLLGNLAAKELSTIRRYRMSAPIPVLPFVSLHAPSHHALAKLVVVAFLLDWKTPRHSRSFLPCKKLLSQHHCLLTLPFPGASLVNNQEKANEYVNANLNDKRLVFHLI